MACQLKRRGTDCCAPCEPPIPICCDGGIPATIYATVTASACAAAVGTTFTCSYLGPGPHTWQGTATIAGCGTVTCDLTVLLTCLMSFNLYVNGNPLHSCASGGGGGAVDCPFVNEVLTGAWTTANHATCDICCNNGDSITLSVAV